MASLKFHSRHDNFFETNRCNRSSARTKIKCKQLSGIDLVVTLDKRDNIKRASITRVSAEKPNATSGKSPDVDNLMPIFEPTHTTSLEEE